MWWTVAASMIGALTAIVIALWVYPEQKRRDRETEIMKERRQAYLEYARAYKSLYFSQPFSGQIESEPGFSEIGEKEQNFYLARDTIYILGTEKVLNAVVSHDNLVREWLIWFNSTDENRVGDLREISSSMVSQFRAVMSAFREDTQHHHEPILPWAVRAPDVSRVTKRSVVAERGFSK